MPSLSHGHGCARDRKIVDGSANCEEEAPAQEYLAYGCSCYGLTRFTAPPREGPYFAGPN